MTAAAELRALHVPGDPLVLPNVWDADSARLVVGAGFRVVATSSAAVAATLGYEDGEQATPDEMFAAAARISAAVDVPLTVDAESGYGLSAAELVDRLFEVDAVGCNLEDTDQQSGRRRPAGEQADLIGAVRKHAEDGLVLNARIDTFLGVDDEQSALRDGIDRAVRYLDAGADCVYPIHVRSADVLEQFVDAVSPAPVNATLLPGGPDITGLARIGVARISLGTGLWRAARSWLADALAGLAKGTTPY